MASVDIFWGGEPEHQSEREFLARLRADLEDRQLDALILANFYLGSGLQVDFLIVTADQLCHGERSDGTLLARTVYTSIDQPNDGVVATIHRYENHSHGGS